MTLKKLGFLLVYILLASEIIFWKEVGVIHATASETEFVQNCPL